MPVYIIDEPMFTFNPITGDLYIYVLCPKCQCANEWIEGDEKIKLCERCKKQLDYTKLISIARNKIKSIKK